MDTGVGVFVMDSKESAILQHPSESGKASPQARMRIRDSTQPFVTDYQADTRSVLHFLCFHGTSTMYVVWSAVRSDLFMHLPADFSLQSNGQRK